MVFGPTPMRKLYLAVPTEYEDRVLAKMGQIGTLHLIREFQPVRGEKSVFVDVNARFERLNEKLDTVLTKEVTQTLAEPIVEALTQKDLEEVEQQLTKSETELTDLLEKLQNLERDIKELARALSHMERQTTNRQIKRNRVCVRLLPPFCSSE